MCREEDIRREVYFFTVVLLVGGRRFISLQRDASAHQSSCTVALPIMSCNSEALVHVAI